jgi:hypothetical protein
MATKKSNQRLAVNFGAVFLIALVILFCCNSGSYAASCQTYAIALTPGANISELNITWYSKSKIASMVEVALKSALNDTELLTLSSRKFYCYVSATRSGYYSNKALVRFLAPNTEYVYRLGDGMGNWTQFYPYTTRQEKQFSFLAVGDPQIGASSTAADTADWTATVAKACRQFPTAAFLMSVGDQVEYCYSESQFAGFLAPEEFKSLPVAPAVGNHDNGAQNHGCHYQLPNLSSIYGVASFGSGDYYFTYGNALFIVLNSNNKSGASHRTFIRNAVAANPNMTWRIVMFHHDIYGSGLHCAERSILNLRATLFPIFDDYAIDIVITGHDHSYTRTHPIKEDIPRCDQTVDGDGSVVNPTGTVYYTLNSASGSKYYDLKLTQASYAAVRAQIRVPTFSHVSIDGNRLTFKTYRTDTLAEVDSYSITKTSGTVAGQSQDGD